MKSLLWHHMDYTTRRAGHDPLLKRSAPAGRVPGLGYIVTGVITAIAAVLLMAN